MRHEKRPPTMLEMLFALLAVANGAKNVVMALPGNIVVVKAPIAEKVVVAELVAGSVNWELHTPRMPRTS